MEPKDLVVDRSPGKDTIDPPTIEAYLAYKRQKRDTLRKQHCELVDKDIETAMKMTATGGALESSERNYDYLENRTLVLAEEAFAARPNKGPGPAWDSTWEYARQKFLTDFRKQPLRVLEAAVRSDFEKNSHDYPAYDQADPAASQIELNNFELGLRQTEGLIREMMAFDPQTQNPD